MATFLKLPEGDRTCKVVAALAILLIFGVATAGVAYGTSYVVQYFIVQQQLFRRQLEEALEWPMRPQHMGPRQPFLYACQSQHCRRQGQHLRRNVAWELKPCDDFYEFACSGKESFKKLLAADAQEHFLREVHAVVSKWGRFGWFRRSAIDTKVSKFYHACLFAPDDVPSVNRQMKDFFDSLNQRIPEVWSGEVSRVLQIFPLVHVSVAKSPVADGEKCVVLRRPESFDSDAILGVPSLTSTKFHESVNNLVGSAAAKDVVDIAWKLRSFPGPYGEANERLDEYNTKSLREVQKPNNWKWEKFLASFLLGYLEVDGSTCVIIRSPEYLSHVDAVTQAFDPIRVRDYFRYAATLHLLPFFRLGKGQKHATEHICSLMTYRLFNFAFLRHFNDKSRFDVLSKTGMKEALLRNSYGYVLTKSSTLPETIAFKILDDISISNKTYFNPVSDVDAYYEPAPYSTDYKAMLTSYVVAKSALAHNWLKYVVGSAGSVFDTNLDVTCHYDPDTKTLGIPLSIAQMDVERKEFFLESSTVGLLMARSLYEAFQDKHVSSGDMEHYRSCFQGQYSSLTQDINGTAVTIDGVRTFRSNIKDNMVLRVLHNAFRSSVSYYSAPRSGRVYRQALLHLEELPEVSSEQIFYLMYAQSFCDPQEDLARVVAEASWSPARIRVNVPLSNYEPFAEAFGCPAMSPMNPSKRCAAA
ncbi:neprilysin-1-like [Ornithodoros turicata]|uniref:neprilysin-1-like n=1 Tax=Ornithodoros turicata TaxID=34597 RepID=UPI0031397954